jgi:hypothetical protein
MLQIKKVRPPSLIPQQARISISLAAIKGTGLFFLLKGGGTRPRNLQGKGPCGIGPLPVHIFGH